MLGLIVQELHQLARRHLALDIFHQQVEAGLEFLRDGGEFRLQRRQETMHPLPGGVRGRVRVRVRVRGEVGSSGMTKESSPDSGTNRW